MQTLAPTTRWPYQVMTFVEWYGHQQEVVLVPEGDGWYSEIPPARGGALVLYRVLRK